MGRKSKEKRTVKLAFLVGRIVHVYVRELRSEVYSHLSVTLPPPQKKKARTFRHRVIIIWPIAIVRHVVVKPHPSTKLRLKKVDLVQEQHKIHFRE